jgi:hypothetical protein
MTKTMTISTALMAAILTYSGASYLMEDSGYLWIIMTYSGGLLTAPVLLAIAES